MEFSLRAQEAGKKRDRKTFLAWSLCSLSCFEYRCHRGTAAYRKTLVSSRNNGFFPSTDVHPPYSAFRQCTRSYRSSSAQHLRMRGRTLSVSTFSTSKTFFAFLKRNNRTINDSNTDSEPFPFKTVWRLDGRARTSWEYSNSQWIWSWSDRRWKENSASAVASTTFVAVALNFMARNAVFSLLLDWFLLSFSAHLRHQFCKASHSGNASSVLSQFNAFDTKATAMAPNAYANSKQLLIFRHAKNERELERRFFECSKIVFRFIRERISFEILEFPCALIRIATPHRSLSASKAIKRANDVRHARKFMTMCCESRNRKASYMQFKWFTPGNIKF